MKQENQQRNILDSFQNDLSSNLSGTEIHYFYWIDNYFAKSSFF